MSKPLHISYPRAGFTLGLTNDSTSEAFPNSGAGPIPTTTEPVTVDESGDPSANCVVVPCSGSWCDIVFIASVDDATYDIRVALWRSVTKPGSTATTLWVPHHLGDASIVANNLTGVAGAIVDDGQFFNERIIYDAYADIKSTMFGRFKTFSPGDNETGPNLTGMLSVRVDGAQKIGIYFDREGPGAPDTCNCLYAFR